MDLKKTINDLFQDEELVKNKKQVDKVLYHASVLNNPKSSPESKQYSHQKMMEIVNSNTTKIPKAPKTPKEPKVKPTSDLGRPKPFEHSYHPDFEKWGISSHAWKTLSPELKQATVDHHKKVTSENIKKCIHKTHSLIKTINELI